MKTNPNDSIHSLTDGFIENNIGLTKREYFSLQAMKSYLDNGYSAYSEKEVAEFSVNMADKLIEKLNE